MDAANVGAEAGCVSIFRDRDKNLDVVGRGAAFELRTRLSFPCVSTVAAQRVTEALFGVRVA